MDGFRLTRRLVLDSIYAERCQLVLKIEARPRSSLATMPNEPNGNCTIHMRYRGYRLRCPTQLGEVL